MAKMAVLRLLFLIGFVPFALADEERPIQIKIDGDDVYRSAYYASRYRVKLSCLPPKESNNKYDQLAIYRGNGSNPEEIPKAPICKVPELGASCELDAGAVPSLSLIITESGYYICKYAKGPESPVATAAVHIYFKVQGNDMKVFDGDAEIPLSQVLQVTNATSYRLACPEAGQSETKVEWYRNEHHMKLDHNANYALNETTQELVFLSKSAKSTDSNKYGGWYRCERISKDGVLLATAFVGVTSRAYAAAAQKSYNKMEGDEVKMSCEIEGEPVPKVTWKRDNKELGTEEDEGNRITFIPYKGIQNASINIVKLVAEDYGEYVCVAKSADGSYAEAPTLLRVRSKLAALWPFLGIVAEVIVLVAVIFIYEKRRAKKEQEENEDAADQKKSLTASNNENKDIRQRKA